MEKTLTGFGFGGALEVVEGSDVDEEVAEYGAEYPEAGMCVRVVDMLESD